MRKIMASATTKPDTSKLTLTTADYPEIRIDQTPTSPAWKLTPLYKVNAVGNTMMWQVSFDGTKFIQTVHGAIVTSDGTPGEMVSTTIEVIPKSTRDMQAQALLDARSRYKDKFLTDGYRPAGVPPPVDCQPALANIWISHAKLAESKAKGIKKDPKWRTIDRWPVAVSAKLDGIRMLAKLSGPQVRCRSRLNRVFPNLDHIAKDLLTFFAYLPAEAELDGELYTHAMSFQELTSAVKTVKTRHPRIEEVQYFIFDIITEGDGQHPMPYENRYNLLLNAYQRYLEDGHQNRFFQFVPVVLASSEAELSEYHRLYVEAGYEGLIIRKLAGENPTTATLEEASYHPGRSSNLLKYKEFIDEEALVIGVEKATGSEEGAAMLMVRDSRDNEFLIRMRGPVERRKSWYENPKQIMGKLITIRYQELTDKGVPRFPVGIAVRDYE
jgi:hypothetical protein